MRVKLSEINPHFPLTWLDAVSSSALKVGLSTPLAGVQLVPLLESTDPPPSPLRWRPSSAWWSFEGSSAALKFLRTMDGSLDETLERFWWNTACERMKRRVNSIAGETRPVKEWNGEWILLLVKHGLWKNETESEFFSGETRPVKKWNGEWILFWWNTACEKMKRRVNSIAGETRPVKEWNGEWILLLVKDGLWKNETESEFFAGETRPVKKWNGEWILFWWNTACEKMKRRVNSFASEMN